MSDTVLIALITAATVVVALLIFRRRLTRLLFRFKGIDAQLTAEPSRRDQAAAGRLKISGNKQVGTKNTIEIAAAEAEMSNNIQKGDANTLRLDQSSKDL